MAAADEITGLVTRFKTTSSLETGPFSGWLVNLMLSGAEAPGFWSGEIVPPGHIGKPEWTLVQRFNTAMQADSFRRSEIRGKLLAELNSDFPGFVEEVSDDISKDGSAGSVATAIVTYVKPGMEAAYWAWEREIQSAQARYPGYKGVYLEPPVPGREGQWATLLRFDSPESLENWFVCQERQELLLQADQFVDAIHYKKLSSSFPGWFPTDDKTGEHPPRWKTAILVVLGLFPVLMMQRRFILPLMSGINTALVVSLNTLMSVTLVTWVTMPLLIKAFTWWLFPKKLEHLKTSFIGLLAAACFLAIEMAALWNLLPVMRRT